MTARAHARTHMAALAAKLGLADLPPDSPILPWAVRHGAWCYHRFAVGADGKTGDGCGLLLQIPEQFFREYAEQQGWNLGIAQARTHSNRHGDLCNPRCLNFPSS